MDHAPLKTREFADHLPAGERVTEKDVPAWMLLHAVDNYCIYRHHERRELLLLAHIGDAVKTYRKEYKETCQTDGVSDMTENFYSVIRELIGMKRQDEASSPPEN